MLINQDLDEPILSSLFCTCEESPEMGGELEPQVRLPTRSLSFTSWSEGLNEARGASKTLVRR